MFSLTPIEVTEIFALIIIVFYTGIRLRLSLSEPSQALKDFVTIAIASWVSEDSCIRLYNFYEYSPGWHLFIDRVPLLIVVIWPFVVLSARRIGSAFTGMKAVLLTSLIVYADATFIEVIATTAGLWSWQRPGPFEVPLIGPFGWGCFAFAIEALSKKSPSRLLVALAAPTLTHGLLLASWWGLFRYVTLPIPDSLFISFLAPISLGVTALLLKGRPPKCPPEELLSRLCAALLFFYLAFLSAPKRPSIVAFVLPFALPWFVLTFRVLLSRAKGVQGKT